MASRWNIHYSRLPADEDDDYDGSGGRQYDPKFDYTPRKVPRKSIALANFLLFLGCFLSSFRYSSTQVIWKEIGHKRTASYGSRIESQAERKYEMIDFVLF
ncbi:unnamed protein product [Ilex paraguariensis]|uniref:Uncharacterized protein n=1 Tax=Ilex paraguariensis TaxID=185542 RepID=A0ABC8RE07_9AQUA